MSGKMPLVKIEDTPPCVMSFVWTIHNLVYWMGKEGEFLESPIYSTKCASWRLGFYPKGQINSEPGFYLKLVSKDTDRSIEVHCSLGIQTSSGKFEEISYTSVCFWSCHMKGFYKCMDPRQIIDQPNKYLQNNDLILRCCIQRCSYKLQVPMHCYAITRILVTKISKTWTLAKIFEEENINEAVIVESNGTYIRSLSVNLGSSEEDVFDLRIAQTGTSQRHLMVIRASVLDAEQKLSCCVKGEHWFRKSKCEQTKTLRFLSKGKLLARKDFYAPKEILTLHLDFVFSFGVKTSDIEKVEYGHVNIKPDEVDESPRYAWMGSWKKLLVEEKFRDATIRTLERDHYVHKAVLSVHSETFRQLFERNKHNVVHIKHLEDKTITKIIEFIYTFSVGDLSWDLGLKLVAAACEFQISPLKSVLANLIKDKLTVQNVCEILVLAVDQQNEKLKSFAQNFILENSDKVLYSDEFKELVKTRGDVTSEVTHLHILKNNL